MDTIRLQRKHGSYVRRGHKLHVRAMAARKVAVQAEHFMKIGRRKTNPGKDAYVDTRYVYLVFDHGTFIIDPRVCPQGIMSYPHYVLTDGEHEAGVPNTRCKCPTTVEVEP